MARNRVTYLNLVILTIALGLFTRSRFIPIELKDSFLIIYAGDTLWAAMVYYIFCIVFPRHSPLRIIIYALTFSYTIELLQLWQVGWLNQIRNTRIGTLILGRGFLWTDFLCYSVGVVLAYLTTHIRSDKPNRG